MVEHRLAEQRRDELRELLAERGAVAVSDLARRWRVSEMTVRRDLRTLAESGAVARVHGGAVAGGQLRFPTRLGRQRREKRSAALKLVSLLPDHGCVYLDGSTTIYHLAEAFARRQGIVAVTNNLDTFQRLASYPGIEALLIGGTLNLDTDNLVGPHAQRALAGLAFDLACCSAFACDAQLGPSEPSPADAEVKRAACARAARVLLAINHHKLGTRAAGCWDPPPERTVLATDLEPRDARLTPYRHRYERIV